MHFSLFSLCQCVIWLEQGNNPKNRTCYPNLCVVIAAAVKKITFMFIYILFYTSTVSWLFFTNFNFFCFILVLVPFCKCKKSIDCLSFFNVLCFCYTLKTLCMFLYSCHWQKKQQQRKYRVIAVRFLLKSWIILEYNVKCALVYFIYIIFFYWIACIMYECKNSADISFYMKIAWFLWWVCFFFCQSIQ